MKIFYHLFAIILVASFVISENYFAQSDEQPLLIVSFQFQTIRLFNLDSNYHFQ